MEEREEEEQCERWTRLGGAAQQLERERRGGAEKMVLGLCRQGTKCTVLLGCLFTDPDFTDDGTVGLQNHFCMKFTRKEKRTKRRMLAAVSVANPAVGGLLSRSV
ncbi:hypothetical protein AOLI_G00306640 [Acnodon oligacanthus]